MQITNPPAVVRAAEQTEKQIVAAVRAAVAQIDDCKWTVGRLAHEWTKRHANGRTDEDFAKLVGLSRAQIQQRRQVFATYGDVCNTCCNLGWSHYREALDWDDAEDWLGAADDNRWSVATMRRMRAIQNRIDRGEDLAAAMPEVEDVLAGFPEVLHYTDVDPYRPEPSIVKPTPRVESETVPTKTEVAEVSKTEVDITTPPQPTTAAPTVETAIDNIAALVVALKPQLEADTSQTLAAQLRRWADEIDPPEESTTATPAAVVAAEWNMITNVSRCSTVTKKRQQTVRARMADEFWRANWREAMQRVGASAFCTGTNDRDWRANFDWFLRPETVARLIEGAYDGNGNGDSGRAVNDKRANYGGTGGEF
tara:strand:- start:7142 stop:8242 length:1101 start_codon:yes stop_codon:yes gene_type:complete